MRLDFWMGSKRPLTSIDIAHGEMLFRRNDRVLVDGKPFVVVDVPSAFTITIVPDSRWQRFKTRVSGSWRYFLEVHFHYWIWPLLMFCTLCIGAGFVCRFLWQLIRR